MTGQKIGYIRVSTPEQNPENQLRNIELDKRFLDVASGKHHNRPQLLEMIEYVREGDVVYTEAIDRIARSLIDLHRIVTTLIEKKVTVKFLRENLTFTGQQSAEEMLRLNIMGSIAEFERSLLRERQREGIANAKRLGLYKGRKRAFTPDEVRFIRDQVEIGVPKTVIAKRFKVCRETIYAYLKESVNSLS